GFCISTRSSRRRVLMLTTAGFRARVSSTQFAAGTAAAGATGTGRSLHSGAAVFVWPRCGARATRPRTAAATAPSQAARYRSASRRMSDLLLELSVGGLRSRPLPGGFQLLAGDRREGAAASQVHRDPVFARHAVHVTRAAEGVGEEEPDRGRAGRQVGGPAHVLDRFRHAPCV